MRKIHRPEVQSIERLRDGARVLVDVARRSRMAVVGGMLVDQAGVMHLKFLLVETDPHGTIGFRDRVGRAVPGELAYGTELTVREARALAS